MQNSDDDQLLSTAAAAISELPKRIVVTYMRLWQLETWLRQMVYIELRALKGNDWQQEVEGSKPAFRQADARLHHMPTPERDPLSYVLFTDLCQTIDNHWHLFEDYLPPQEIWMAKLKEIAQVRNRVAHFRIGHEDDLRRVLQLMRDIDQGFWRFCTSYNNSLAIVPPSADPVVKRFAALNQFPYVKIGPKEWAMAGVADPQARINVTVEALRRPWQQSSSSRAVSGKAGYLYDVQVVARDNRIIDYHEFLEATIKLHADVVHICLDALSASVRITIPAVLGTRSINTLIQRLIEPVNRSLHYYEIPRGDFKDQVQRLADKWPEYVLGPKNPLTFLDPSMPCSFFSV